MKTNTQTLGRIAAVILSGGALLATAIALETHATTAAKPPAVAVDTKPLDRSSGLPASFSSIIKKISPSVVKIDVTAKSRPAADSGGLDVPGLREFFEQRGLGRRRGPMQMPREHGAASGVIVTPDGYILTNNHVVDHADKVDVVLNDGRQFEAKVIGTDPKTDLAVVKIEAADLPAVAFADSNAAEVGDVVLAAGNAFGIGQSVTMGMISALGRATLGLDYEDFIQTDAAINPGNSGGALVDVQGRLVGINTAILSRSGGNDGIGFAIPSNMARNIMNELISSGRVTRAFLGVMIQDLTPSLAGQFKAPADTRGALVDDVSAKSPAAVAGLESGDIITHFAGREVKDARNMKLTVAEHKPGETAEIKILRGGLSKVLSATLTPLPADTQDGPAPPQLGQSDEGSLNGVGVTEISPDVRRGNKIPSDVHGALITNVEQDSPAWEAGLRPGDIIQQINHQNVSSAEEAVKVSEDPSKGESLVKIWSHGGSRFLTVNETRSPRVG
jgi:serine protease Do